MTEGFAQIGKYSTCSLSPLLNLCLLGNFPCFFVICWFFQNQLFGKILSGSPSECQTVWIQIRPDILSGLIWVQIVCKGYQQTTPVGKALNHSFSSLSLKSMFLPQKIFWNVQLNEVSVFLFDFGIYVIFNKLSVMSFVMIHFSISLLLGKISFWSRRSLDFMLILSLSKGFSYH